MTPVIKAVIIFFGLLWTVIFALAIPLSTRTLANRIVKLSLRNSKRTGKYTRQQVYAPQNVQRKVVDNPGWNFPDIPCFIDDISYYAHGLAMPYNNDGSCNATKLGGVCFSYNDLARDPLNEYNWRFKPGKGVLKPSADINVILGYDCILHKTPHTSEAWCTRPLVCYAIDDNATSCNCYWFTVSLSIGKRYPVKRNANRKITMVLDYYTHDTQALVRKIAINSNGLALNAAARYIPGEAWVPSWHVQAAIGTTKYAKTFCNKYLNLKECFSTYISEDLRVPKKVTKPGGTIVLSTIFLALDVIAFMVLFAISGGAAKVGPAK